MSAATLDALATVLLVAVALSWLGDIALIFRGATWNTRALPATVGEVCGAVLALHTLSVIG